MLDRVVLPQKDNVHSLEVLLDSTLMLDKQVVAAARGMLSQLPLVCQP